MNFEQAGRHTKEKCVRHAYQNKTDRAQHADEERGQHRGAHVPCERVIDVLEHLSTAAAKPPARQGQQNIPAEGRTVLQEEKRHDRNQNEPRQIAQQGQQAAKAVTQRGPGRVDRASKRSIDGLANALGVMIGVDEVLPRLQLVARVGHVAGN
jgi:hypothetical protein